MIWRVIFLLLMVEMIESERSQKKGVVITIARSSSGYANEMGTEAKNLFVADDLNHRIRKISSEGMVSTFAGTGISGDLDGVNLHAQFNHPQGIAKILLETYL